MKYEDYINVLVKQNEENPEHQSQLPTEDLATFIFEAKKIAQDDEVFYAGSQDSPPNGSYSFSLREDAYRVTNIKTLKALIGFLISVKEYDLAFELITKTRDRFEQQFVNLQCARILLAKGDYTAAAQYLPKKMNNYDKCYITARVKEGLNEIEEAIKTYEKSIQYKIVPEVYYRIGLLSLKIEKKSKAIQNLILAHKINYKNKEIARAIGTFYYNEGDYRNAIKYFSMLKRDLSIEKYLGISYLMAGDREKAKKKFKSLLKREHDEEIFNVTRNINKSPKQVDFTELLRTSLTLAL